MPKYLIQYSIEEIILLESALKGKLAEIKEIIISAKKKKEYFTADYYEECHGQKSSGDAVAVAKPT